MTQKQPKNIRVEAILRAAEDEFLEKGYELATMDSIARRAKLSKGALYHHFAGKDEILVAANISYFEVLGSLFAEAESVKSPSRALLGYVKAYLSYWDANRKQVEFMFLTMTKAMAHEEIWHYYQEYSEKARLFMSRLFKRGVEQGEFVAHDGDARALCLLGTLDGLLGYLIMDKSLTLSKAIAAVKAMYIDGIRVKSPAQGRK